MNAAVAGILERFGLGMVAEPLRDYLPRQRWFAGRDRSLESVTVDDAIVLRDADPAVVVLVVSAHYADGEEERYHVPLAVVPAGHPIADSAVIASVDYNGPALACDAMADGAAAWEYWVAAATGTPRAGAMGRVSGRAASALIGEGAGSIRALTREQSNSSVVRNDAEIMKCLRRLSGHTPEVEMLEALAAAGFGGIAAPLGIVEYHPGQGGPEMLAVIQPYLHNGSDGWAMALASLRDLYAVADELASAGDTAADVSVRDQGSSFEAEAARLGEVIAGMHLALADPGLPDGMRSHPAGPDDLRTWHLEMRHDIDSLLETHGDALPELRQRRSAIEAIFDAVLTVQDPGTALRQHGDLHLGQVLRTDAGWTILDFEGEPARPGAARRLRSSQLRDVAGMLRSFDYAAMVELTDWTAPGEPAWERLRTQGETWATVNGEVFMTAYSAVVAGRGMLPPATDAAVLLRAFKLQKAIYEVAYELNHRPAWVSIPVDFILRSVA